MGYHNSLYYRNFDKPDLQNRFNVEWGCLMGFPDGWRERQPEEVQARIEELAGFKVSAR